jgi:hypothetical protein
MICTYEDMQIDNGLAVNFVPIRHSYNHLDIQKQCSRWNNFGVSTPITDCESNELNIIDY